MKKLIHLFALSALALGAALSSGQAAEKTSAPSDEAHPRMQQAREQRMKQLDEKLHLTPEQKAQIEAIWAKSGKEARELRKEDQQARGERRKQARETMRETRKQVRAVLTPEQQKLFDEMPKPGRRGLGAEKSAQ